MESEFQMPQLRKFKESFTEWVASFDGSLSVVHQVAQGEYVSWITIEHHETVLTLALVAITSDMRNSINYDALKVGLESERKNGRNAVILWEDFWVTKPEIVKSRIMALLGISEKIAARLTKARRIDKKTATAFLNNNHLQGVTNSKYQFGIYLPNRYFRILSADLQKTYAHLDELLVGVATFSHVRIFEKNDNPYRSFEMIRFANRLNTTVVGGLNKLLAAFVKDLNPDDIMTYADLDWSNGNSYRRIGFEEISKLRPLAIYIDSASLSRIKAKSMESKNDTAIVIQNTGSIKFVKQYTHPQ